MIRAKFRVESVVPASLGDEELKEGAVVTLRAVVGGSPENDEFYRLTPGGEIKLSVVKAETAAKFEVGKEYYVDFTEVE